MANRSKTTLTLGLLMTFGLSAAALAQEAQAPAADTAAAETPAADNPGDASPRPGIAGGHSQAAFIASHDLNGDGKVSEAEVVAARSARFFAADRDGDGKLSEAEYVAEYARRAVQQYYEQGRDITDERFQNGLKQAAVRFALLDRDRDGFLSLEEDLLSARKTFARNDTDGDGFVTAADPAPKRERDNDDDQAAATGATEGEKATDGDAN